MFSINNAAASCLTSQDTRLNPNVDRPLALIIDDEPSITESLAQVLGDESLRTVVAHNGFDGLEKLVEHSPDLVFLDIWMPELDGIQTLERIRVLSPNTSIVMMSGHATIANAIEATKKGAFDFIEKPLDLGTVIEVSKRALGANIPSHSGIESRSVGLCIPEGLRHSYSLLTHPGITSNELKGNNIGQRTLAESAILYGQGLHSGKKSGLILEPLGLNAGIHFVLMGRELAVPAFVDFVESTSFATTVRNGDVFASTIEHLMATLHAHKISNLLIKCNGEIPILDGSAIDFCKVIQSVGISEQGGDWYEIMPNTNISVVSHNEIKKSPNIDSTERNNCEYITLKPSNEFTIAYHLDYPDPVGKQFYEFNLSSVDSFITQIAPARTFGFMKDIERLQKMGLAAGGRLDNFILIGSSGFVNTTLRFPDELARHKILDIMGDLFLLGRPIRARVDAHMTGHFDNIKALEQLRKSLPQ